VHAFLVCGAVPPVGMGAPAQGSIRTFGVQLHAEAQWANPSILRHLPADASAPSRFSLRAGLVTRALDLSSQTEASIHL
jgi:hypothetical protein